LSGRVVLVPFHLARLGKRIVGLDAFFWPSLEKRYRVVLLVHPAERLGEAAMEGCRLPVQVDIGDQIGEIREIAQRKPEKPRTPRATMQRRFAWFLLPLNMLRDMLRSEAEEFQFSEELQAVGLAKIIRELEPLGETRYAAFEPVEEDGEELLLPVDGNMRRIYRELARRDKGYRRAASQAGC